MLKGLLVLLVIMTFQAQAVSEDKNPLKEYIWKNRILVLNIVGEHDWRSQEKTFLKNMDGNLERDLILKLVSSIKDPLFERFNFKPSEFSLALVGKDGTLKKRYNSFTSMDEIYQAIDQMPMRRRVLKNKAKD